MFLLGLYILYQIAVSQCSLIFDELGHKSTIDYCGQIGSCKPGEHVMCMYFRPESTMAPTCTGQPIALKEENRELILSRINQMRKGITYGNITGKNNALLPKGYGLKDLEWDDELARFAQLWANQCSFDNGDLCRATERFPNPGQFMGGIRYSYPNFKDSGIRTVLMRSKTMIEQKSSTIIESVLNMVYNTKFLVTSDMIFNHVGTGRRNLFLLTVYGGTTHIGCAMSYWISYHVEGKSKGHNLFSAALVCNLSAQPVEGQKVYETDQAKFQWSGSKSHSTKQKITKKIVTRRAGCNHNQNEEPPSMVLMPILRIDEKSLTDQRSTKPPTAQKGSNKVESITLTPKKRKVTMRKLKTKPRPKKQKLESKGHVTNNKSIFKPPITTQRRNSQINTQRMIDVKDRYFNRNIEDPGLSNLNDENLKPDSMQSAKKPSPIKHDSIFARVSKFELPSQHQNLNHEGIIHSQDERKQSNSSQKLSTKDLLLLKELVAEYFVKKQSRPHNSPVNVINPLINTMMQFLDTYPTYNSKDAVNPYNQRFRELRELHNIEYNNPNKQNRFHLNEEIDEKLLNFMYNLVQASGVDFNEIIDATTRIIQGDRIGKELSEAYRRKMEEEPSNMNRLVKLESEFTPLVAREQNPLLPYGKEIFGNIKRNYQYAIGKNEYTSLKNNLADIGNAEQLFSLRNIDGHTRYLGKHNMNDYYAIENAAGAKMINYFPENIRGSERAARNRHDHRHRSYLTVDLRPLFRPVINI